MRSPGALCDNFRAQFGGRPYKRNKYRQWGDHGLFAYCKDRDRGFCHYSRYLDRFHAEPPHSFAWGKKLFKQFHPNYKLSREDIFPSAILIDPHRRSPKGEGGLRITHYDGFNERALKNAKLRIKDGWRLMGKLLKKQIDIPHSQGV